MQKFKSVEQIINQLKPEKPIYCIRKNSIRSAGKIFQQKFSWQNFICCEDKSTPCSNPNDYR
jgi:hypothetical protein